MRAVGYFRSGPLSEAKPLEDVEVPEPSCGEFDIVVDVKAISVNPVDYKVRCRSAPAGQGAGATGWIQRVFRLSRLCNLRQQLLIG